MNIPLALATLAPSLGIANGDGGVSVLRVVLALGFCLALGIAAVWLMRYRHRLAIQRPGSPLQVVQSLRIDARTSVHIIRYGEREHLLACGPAGIALAPLTQERVSPQTLPQDANT